MKQPDFLTKEEGMNHSRIVPSYIQSECQCELCTENYDLSNHMPMMICEQQHNCCFTCAKGIIAIKKVCPFCRSPIAQERIRKNRMIAKIIEEVAKIKSKSDKSVSLSDFQLGNCLDQGAFDQVFPAKHKKTNMLVAIKKVKKESVKHMLDQFVQSIKIQMFLDHPNIVKVYGFFDDSLHFYIIMEYMEGGSLYSYIKKNKKLSIEETSLKLKEICQGLKNMHNNSIQHRDIKPENVVMTNGVCKLCDFGWSAIFKDRRTIYCDTLDYVPPEIIEKQGYDDCVDIWCVGVLTYELLVGTTPFYNISRKETMKKIMDCSLQYPQDLPQIAVNFMKRILRKNPQERTNIDKILQDPFLKLNNQKLN